MSLELVAPLLWLIGSQGIRRFPWLTVTLGAIGLGIPYLFINILINFWGGLTSRWTMFRLYEPSYHFNILTAAMPALIFFRTRCGLDRAPR